MIGRHHLEHLLDLSPVVVGLTVRVVAAVVLVAIVGGGGRVVTIALAV